MEPHLRVRQVLQAGYRVHVHLVVFSLALLFAFTGGAGADSAPRVTVIADSAGGMPQPRFCGLARTVNGFDYVRATSFACDAARATVVAIESGRAGTWVCSRNMGGDVELTCVGGAARIELLERSPTAAVRHGTTVTLANWTFRRERRTLQGRGDGNHWVWLGPAPWCVPDVPREVLVAFGLEPLTPNGGCFTLRP